MRIRKDVSKINIASGVILLAICLVAIYRNVNGYIHMYTDAIMWIMLMVLFQNIIFIFEPKEGFENKEEETTFLRKSDSNAFALTCIILIIVGFVFNQFDVFFNLDSKLLGIYLLALGTGVIFIRMIVYIINCIMHKGK